MKKIMTRPKPIQLGSLPEFEYRMLRAAIMWGACYCDAEAEGEGDWMPNSKRWRDRADECRALLARFGKSGRKK